ncbi:Serine phosphatase RsbU, regulator of sigma subunit [Rathayibacter oskolensis]|uniref:Serine phosphatase RsbU, regulator of sigma subunit n=1 Tax=Rathayibacter oskolensis TaxID=1891671 RepID=A0A1X7NYY9_9MICO|nr:SpoIIE family protein phosphatase [Rathayibacter oskolensis]SMH43531.1 Serine phosphatase RsbU, regulator of sigma subunit [Rathayibacter oskolensis]
MRSTTRPRSTTAGAASRLSAAAIGLDEQSPLVKQIPVAFLFGVAVALSLLVPTIEVTDPAALVLATAAMITATALAAVLPRIDPGGRAVLVVPVVDFLVVGVLRFATGESASIFASLAILPTVWVAASAGRRSVALAFVGICAGLVVPFLLGSTLEENPNELTRGLFSAVAFVLAGAVVNDLARLARAHVEDVRARERSTLLELDEAALVQQALLPKTDTDAAGYEFAGACLPSKAVGGDFFDWYAVSGGTAFTLGDVMGKGVGAGIIAATVRAVIRSARSHEDLAVPLDRAADALSTDLGDTASFATLFHARLDHVSGEVRYVDAGHGLTLHVRADGSWERLAALNLPVGIWSDEAWSVSRVLLEPGDSLVSCSDGILDLYDGTVESLQHVAEIVAESSDSADVVSRLRALTEASLGREDDVTVLVLLRLPV